MHDKLRMRVGYRCADLIEEAHALARIEGMRSA